MRNGVLAIAVCATVLPLAGCGSQAVDDLWVGDCFLADPDATEFSVVTHVDCNITHDYEVLYVHDFPSTMEYDEDAISDAATKQCMTAFKNYVGVDYSAPEALNLVVSWFIPGPDDWDTGARGLICLVQSASGERLRATVRNSLGG